MIDSHSHIDHKQFDHDRSAMLQRAFEAGVEAIIIPAIEPARFDSVLALAASDTRLYCGLGIHPHHALEATDEALARIEALSDGSQLRVQAIGEIGLDYHYDFAPRDVQQVVFRRQLRIAHRRKLPVIVHNRESDEDLFRILREEQDNAHGELRGVLHCFSSSPERAEEAINLGFHVSFTGNITFKSNTALLETVAAVPLERCMIETDAPYMAPIPYRGKRNEPAFVGLVAQKIAEIRSATDSLSLQTILSMTTHTAQKLFRLALAILVSLFALLAVPPDSVFAQRPTDDDDDEIETTADSPFKKKLGIGITFGGNTLVEFFTAGGQAVNNPLALSGGGNLAYHFTDNFSIEALYMYSVNIAITRPDATGRRRQENPNYHQLGDLSLKWTFNPANVIGFYVLGGGSYLSNSFDASPFRDFLGFHGGFGLGANIKTGAGIFHIHGELRFCSAVGLNERRVLVSVPGGPPEIRTQTGFFYSIQRVGLMWYPSF